MFKLYKLSGAGNTFLFIDLRKKRASNTLKKAKRRELARQFCDPHQFIGADGLLFLESSKIADVKWDFYNADGSQAEMCGNATRCVGRFLQPEIREKLIASGADLNVNKRRWIEFTLETAAGIVTIEVPSKIITAATEEIVVRVALPTVQSYQPNQRVRANKQSVSFDYVNTSVPHSVVQLPSHTTLTNKIKNVDNYENIVNSIRSLPIFRRSGTNVTFYSAHSKGKIHSLTFERGVKGFTQACGTGAIAASTSFLKNKPGKLSVRVPGGLLHVDLSPNRALLIGPAKLIAEIRM